MKIMDLINRVIRLWLQSAPTKESLRWRMELLAPLYKKKYTPLAEMAATGVKDVIDRHSFLKVEAQGDILDVGCYDGFFVNALSHPLKLAVGVDILGLCCEYAKKHSNSNGSRSSFVCAYSEELPFASRSFDTTIVSHTLEHVFDVGQTLSEASRVTRVGGKLIAIVPPDLGRSPAHLRVVTLPSLYAIMVEYCVIEREIHIGKGSGYMGIVR